MTKNAETGAQGRVLITGVAGYIGSQTAYCFLDAGWQVIGIDDFSQGTPDRVPPGVVFFQMDAASDQLSSVLAREKVDAVLHFAGRISVDESLRKPAEYYHANTAQAARVFDIVSRAGVRALVFASTAAVYGEVGRDPVSETQTPRPDTPYGRSKLAAEWALQDIGVATGLPFAALRFFNVAGADPQGRTGPRQSAHHLIKRAAEAAQGHRPEIVIHGTDYDTPDGSALRDYLHVADLAAAHLAAVEHLLGGGASFVANCGYGCGYSVREVVERAQAMAPHPFGVREGPRRPGDMSQVIADATLLNRTLDWSPAYDRLDTILRHALDWERRTGVPIGAQ